MSGSGDIDKITDGVAKVHMARPRRGSDIPTKEVQKGRRRLSLAAGNSKDKAYKLDGYAEEKDAARFERRGSTKPVDGALCYRTFSKLSKVGYAPFNSGKVNQDRPLAVTPFRGSKAEALFGVFDGHGAVGHEVSQFVIQNMEKYVEDQGDVLDSNPHKALSDAFVRMNNELSMSRVDCSFSGTTAVMCYMNGNKVYCANSGDSRAVLARKDGGKIRAVDLSDDQKPERPDEAARIIRSGGRVEACKDQNNEDIGPKRVWLKHQDVPGLAMTRSFGDQVAHGVGVSAVPEVKEVELGENDLFIVICSDGVWEFITSQECVDIVASFEDDKGNAGSRACKALVDESYRRWRREEEVVDDTTAVIVYLQ